MTVTETQVRNLLDGPAATSVLSATITDNITRSLSYVTSIVTSTATPANIDEAVKAMAVWLTYGSYMEGITQQLGAISIADEVKLDHLRLVAELFINQISATPISLDVQNQMDNLQGINPSVFTLSTSEGFKQEDG